MEPLLKQKGIHIHPNIAMTGPWCFIGSSTVETRADANPKHEEKGEMFIAFLKYG